MAAFFGLFLKHLTTIWSQFFVSPYVLPTALSLALFDGVDIEDAPIAKTLGDALFLVPAFAIISIFTALIQAILGLLNLSLGVGFAPLLAYHAWQTHFQFEDGSFINDSLFYGDCYWMFFFFYCTVS